MANNAAGDRIAARPHLSGVIVAATIGNILEWYDFLVYGFFAATLAEVFFPTGDPTLSLLITFGAFGLSYVVRPLGAIFIGNFTDRSGRKAGLTLSIALMMIGTTMMVVTPAYATIGIAAPVIITIARLLQGFSVGGEFGSAVAFLVEHAGARKGYSASWQWSSTGVVAVIVALFGVALTTLLTHQQLVDWGWRIPWAFGLLIGPVGLWIRSRIAETPEFLGATKPPSVPIGDLLQSHPIPVLLAIGASVISNSSYYLLLYIPTYAVRTLHLPAYTGFVATLVGGVILAVFSVLAGHWSDRTARPRIMLAMAGLFIIAAYPVFWLMVAHPSLATAMFAVGFLNLIKAGYSGVLPSLLAEQFPVALRAVGIAFSYSVSVVVFGGFAPFVATWLIAWTGDPLSPSFYLMATAVLSMVALVAIERRTVRMSEEPGGSMPRSGSITSGAE
ncbi:MAG TPA: MFS transporter [Acetobacteraceae bacterium]|nr:MFS transporter [Acetobacteraceae bacterium]